MICIWCMRHDNVMSWDYESVIDCVYVSSWVCVKLWYHTCIEILCAFSYELWTIQSHDYKPFKGDELMRNEYCDHCGNPTSWITLSLCRSLMIEAFSQNSVTLTGLTMILPSESDMTYNCVVCLIMYSYAFDNVFHWHGITLHIWFSLSESVG